MTETIPFRQQVAREMIRAIEDGTAAWVQPWEPGALAPAPFNPVSGRPYRGINSWWLDLQGHQDPRWMTFRQAGELGASVRKGEKATSVEYWKWQDREPVLDGNGDPARGEDGRALYRTVRLERPKVYHARVFNAEQIVGLEPYRAPEPGFEPVAEAERVLQAGGVEIRHDQPDQAFYQPGTDSIHLPPRAAFKSAYDYYATALHELGHATGHPSRLARQFGAFGSEQYAIEELRAEMASFGVSRDLGLGHYPERHAGYVQSWLKALRDDPKHLFRAARDAETIRDWVMEPEKRQALARMAAERANARREAAADKARDAGRDRRYLTVPFEEKDLAKAAGAKWDRRAKSWYAPEGVDPDRLARWDAPKEENEMKRRYLTVPFEEKDLAKAAGAKWDRRAKSWYAPEGADPARLARWDRPGKDAPAARDPAKEFATYLAENGLRLDGDPIMDGKWHRAPVEGDRGAARSGSYRGFLDGVPAGTAINFKAGGEAGTWIFTGNELSGQDLEQARAEATRRRVRREREAEARRARTAETARAILSRAAPVQEAADARDAHPYLARKRVDGRGVYAITAREAGVTVTGRDGKTRPMPFEGERLLAVPLRDRADRVVNLQLIDEAGNKRFLQGGRKAGAFGFVGTAPRDGLPATVFVAEGLATAKAVSAAWGDAPVLIAFDAGNLAATTAAARERYPEADLVIAADADKARKVEGRDLKPGVGQTKAREAAARHGARVIFAQVVSDAGPVREIENDFNALLTRHGRRAVERAIARQLPQARQATRERPAHGSLGLAG